jgi:hypothetical protein
MLWGSPKRGGLPFARHADDARECARAGRAVTQQRDTQTRPEIVREACDCDLSHKG